MDTFEDYNNTRPPQPQANQEDYDEDDDDDENRLLPGFRFQPTDEELVGFYLRAKVDEKPLKIDHLIQDTDIYKHNPWDLPKTSDKGNNSEEMYFFCKRGKKYKNSERPNRVITGSGFWKATGIDKPIYNTSHGGGSSVSSHHRIIGLKKTLVYYRGSAGKGTKTQWMMHELRLANSDSYKPAATQEAEVWTVCRIFRRVINISNKTYTGNYGELSSKQLVAQKNKSCATMVDLELDDSIITRESYISFATDQTMDHHYNDHDDDKMSMLLDHHASLNLQNEVYMNEGSGLILNDSSSVLLPHHQAAPSATACASSLSNFNTTMDLQMDQQFVGNYESWDELRYMVHQFDLDSSHL